MKSLPPSEESTQGETQFIPQSDDEETLWEVIEITAERPTKYKVKWSGLDPATGRPWPQSWVPKVDCTDDLRRQWKKKLKKKKEEAKKDGEDNLRLSPNLRKSTTSTTTTTVGRRSATATASSSRPPESNSSSRISNKPESAKRKRKSGNSCAPAFYDDDSDREPQVDLQPEAGSSRPHKRRNVLVEIIKPAKKYEGAIPQDIDDEFNEEVRGAAKVIPAKAKDKRKGKEKTRDSEVPLSKMGPPRGVKKQSASTALRKTDSPPSKTHSKSDPSSNIKSTKSKNINPSPSRFRRSPSVPLYADDSPLKPQPRKRPPQTENHEEMDMTHPDPSERQVPLFSPRSDDGYPDCGVQSQALAPPMIPNTPSDDAHIDYDAIPESEPAVGLPLSAPGPPGGYFLSPEVPATQSQELDDLQSGVDNMEDGAPPEPLAIPPSDTEQAKMKPRSKSNSADGPVSSTFQPIQTVDLRTNKKPLRPVPQLSPSTFRPHLPAPTSSQDPDQDDPIEMEGPPSSIESFGSTEKKNDDSRKLESIRNWGEDGDGSTQKSRDTILSDDDALRARGQELADMRQRERERTRKREREKDKLKRPLSEVIEGASSESESQVELAGEDELMIVQEMEDAYVDLSGGEGSQGLPVPQEEEESTQDLELEKRWLQRLAAERDVIIKPVDHGLVEEASNTDPLVSKLKSKSGLNYNSIFIGPADKIDEELPPTLSPPRHHRIPEAQVLSRPQSEPPQSPTNQLDTALNLLNVKSEEILTLQTTLAREVKRNEDLTAANQQLEEALASAKTLASQPSPDAIALEEARIQWSQTTGAWIAERKALVTSIDDLTRSKASAETDRDFFRNQYAQASMYVGSVRSENTELEQRALVAEGKAKDGVAMIKATYDGRLNALQMDVARWKGLAELLQEKDRRTGDEIRRKAGEEPGLRMKNAELREEINALTGVVFDLSREREFFQFRLSNTMEDVDGLGARDDTGEVALLNGAATSRGNELVYRCLWRPGGSSGPCLNVFSSPEDLEAHMYSDTHLVEL